MKSMRLCATLTLCAFTAGICAAAPNSPPSSSLPGAAAAVSPAPGPLIQVDQADFDFGKVSSSEKVRHTYIITNTGSTTLQISNVHPSCGCTTAGAWTRDIAPGKTGEIPVQFDSSRYNGTVTKTIEVDSNARNEPRKTLFLRGSIWKPIDVIPSFAVISVPPDATNEVPTTVRIINQTGQPVAISNAVSVNRRFRAALKETKPGKEYELVITAQPPFSVGTATGTITLNTSLPGTPSLTVTAMTSVAQAVLVYPPQIVLNTLPERWTTNRITIRGNSTIPLTVSNPKCSDSRVQIELRPTGAPGLFTVLVSFPPGYHLEPGQRVEVTVESNHPRFQVIKIPLVEYPRPKPYAAFPAHPNPPPQNKR